MLNVKKKLTFSLVFFLPKIENFVFVVKLVFTRKNSVNLTILNYLIKFLIIVLKVFYSFIFL